MPDVQYTISTDRGDAAVGVIAGERECAIGAALRELPCAGDDSRERLVV